VFTISKNRYEYSITIKENLMGNVISLAEAINKKVEEDAKTLAETPSPVIEEATPQDLEALMKKNQENKERMARDRLKDNKGVIKTYKLLK
jgi:hypothetical protein